MLLDSLAARVSPVTLHFLWRPQLRDANDEMVLETALNGVADALVTFNASDFQPVAGRLGLRVWTPAECLRFLEGEAP